MTAIMLRPRPVERIWGRRDLPFGLGGEDKSKEPIGEIWFEDPSGRDLALLVKLLFTSESLSVQVHPDDQVAARHGHRRGKEEAWWVLAAEDEARIGFGLKAPIGGEELRRSAGDGRIVDMLNWIPAMPGQFHYVPAGTIHALGAGLSLVEIQQNVDLTYRLFDFGRGRELQLDLAIEATETARARAPAKPVALAPWRTLLARGGAFVVEKWVGPYRFGAAAASERPIWLVPIAGTGTIDCVALGKGQVWLVEKEAEVDLATNACLLAAYQGGEPWPDAFQARPHDRTGQATGLKS